MIGTFLYSVDFIAAFSALHVAMDKSILRHKVRILVEFKFSKKKKEIEFEVNGMK